MLLSIAAALLSLSSAASGLTIGTRQTPDFLQSSIKAAETLQKLFYNEKIGLWVGAGPDAGIPPEDLYLTSASCLGVLGLLGSLDNTTAPMIEEIIENTFVNAAAFNSLATAPSAKSFSPKVFITDKFINSDIAATLLWGLSFNHAFDLTGEKKYLDAGVQIFQQIAFNHANATCGGVWADPEHTRMDAITNNEFLALASHLATRVENGEYYLNWTLRQFDFIESTLIGPDSLELAEFDSHCNAVGQPETYTNGVLIGGLLEINKAIPNETLVEMATTVGRVSIQHFSDANGIITEPGSPHIGLEGGMKKGLYIRHIVLLASLLKDASFIAELIKQAESIIATDTSPINDTIGILWDHYLPVNQPSGHCGGLDALVAAATVA